MCVILTIRNRLFKSVTLKKLFVVISFSVVLLFYEIFVYSASSSINGNFIDESEIINSGYSSHNSTINLYYKSRQSWSTSNLGSILFKNIPRETFRDPNKTDRTFVVLIWKHWNWLQARHVRSFNNAKNSDPLNGCSVKNCVITGNDSLLDTADAVVIHLQKGEFPDMNNNRNPDQRWIFLNDESPLHAFSMSQRKPELSSLANVFNWSMSYRSDSDIPVPYGRTVPLSESTTVPIIPHWTSKQRDVLAAILISNCAVSYRMKYLNELKQHVSVDVHGKCSNENKTSCPGHFRSDCGIMAQYLFYLVFENSMCKEYLTEKSFYHAYGKGAIPVFLGPSLEDCKKLLPPNSYLHVDNFETPLHLAKEMIEIGNNLKKLLSFHQWRNDFEILNEHGYFGSKSLHLCRICEALNYNDEQENIYSEDDLKDFLDPLESCDVRK